jgi:flagellar biosynthesis protein FlhB
LAEGSFEERTEKATPRRRGEAKSKGQVAKSKEITSIAVLFGGLFILTLFGTSLYLQLSNLMVHWFTGLSTLSIELDNVQDLTLNIVVSLVLMVGPVLGSVFLMAVIGHCIQGSNVFTTKTLNPTLDKINLIEGLKKLVSKQSVVELLKSLLKLLIIGTIAYSTIKKEWPDILLLFGQDVGNFFHVVSSLCFRLLLRTGMVLLVLAVLDYIYQRWTFERNLRMSKEEVKEEYKMTEGDPRVKSHIRTVQRQLARQRMMAEVPKADVIITNPTHLAIALCYENKTMEAPQVIAKGAGHVAQKIIEIGRSHGVPFVENKPLARALYKTVELGGAIPSTLYHAVADILAYVYKLKNKKLS